MIKFISSSLWATIREMASQASRRRAAVAYVTDSSLLPLGQDDVLIVDASDQSISTGRTVAVALETYLEAGVRLFSVGNLHAKVIILDDVAIVGSGNVSRRSASHYIEAAVISDRPELRGQTERFINDLLESASSSLIDRDFVDRIKKIEVFKSANPPEDTQPVALALTPESTRFWLVQTWEDTEYPGDAEQVEAECQKVQQDIGENSGLVYWFWGVSKSLFGRNAQVGDIVIETWRERKDFSSTDEITVYKHAIIAKIYREDGQSVKTFHCVYPPDWEKTAITWSEFEVLAERAGVKRKLRAGRDVQLNERESAALFDIWS